MEYVITVEEVAALDQTTINELEVELYYDLFIANQAA